MKQNKKIILELVEDLKDTLENDLINQQTENKKINIKDIKYVGQAKWKDKINGNDISENIFIVEKEIKEIGNNGKERVLTQEIYYLGDKAIGGKNVNDNQIIYKESFINSELDKMKAINDLLERTSKKDIEENSMNLLKTKELSEILTAYFGKEISEEDAKKILEEMDKSEIEKLEDEKKEQKDKDEKDLSKKQIEKIEVNGIQKADLNKKVDGKETLGERLDLKEYDNIYIVYSDKVDEIGVNNKKNNTMYSLVGMTKDGEAKVLNEEFEMDKSVGNNVSREQTKIRANNVATRDNNDLSVYTRKSNGMSIGCENNNGYVDMFLYQKTLEENENVGIQIETSQTPVIPIEIREIMNRNKGIYQKDKIQDEVEEHTQNGCEPQDVKDFDGEEYTRNS